MPNFSGFGHVIQPVNNQEANSIGIFDPNATADLSAGRGGRSGIMPPIEQKKQNQKYERRDFNWRRTNRRNPCPVCHHTDWCEISEDGWVIHCMRRPGDKEVNWRGGGWLHFLRGEADQRFPSAGGAAIAGQQPVDDRLQQSPDGTTIAGQQPVDDRLQQLILPIQNPKSKIQNPKTALAPAEVRAAAIEWLLDRLEQKLSREHLEYLASEDLLGLGSEVLQYRTLPGDFGQRSQLLAGLDATFGREVTRSLGFVYERTAKGGNRYLEFAGVLRGVDALLIPVRDLSGRPVALKARSVEPETNERHYRAMSSGNTELGASVGTPIHVARPLNPIPGLEKWVIVTEGEKKADYAAQRMGLTVLGVQGVSSWRSGKLLTLLQDLGVEQVIEAFDADRAETGKRGKQNVEQQAWLLSAQCAAAGYRVFSARWPLNAEAGSSSYGKGLDDFLRCQSQIGKSSEIEWPVLHRFKPVMETEITSSAGRSTGGADEEFQTRYGISRERAGRIARQFVEVDVDTVTPVDYLVKQARLEKELLQEDSKSDELEKARLDLALLFGGAFEKHLVSKGEETRQILVRSTTGTGKTTAALNQIVLHLSLGRPGRILYLTDTKQAYAHLFGPGAALEEARQLGRVAIREGRSELPGQYHCERLADCRTLGMNRQPASADVCGSCPFGSMASWKAYAGNYGFDPEETRPFECEKAGYLASVRRCKEAQVVIAPKAAVLNGSSELAEFDFVIVDEDCVGFLLECQELGAGQLAEWEDGRRRLELGALIGPEVLGQKEKVEEDEAEAVPLEVLRERHTPFDALFGLVRAALSDFEVAGKEALGRARFMPVLKARAEMQGVNLAGLVGECLAVLPSRRFKRYPWEKPYRNYGAAMMVAPLRFARDLVELVSRELDCKEGADTRLWVERRSGGAVVVAYLPRQHLINILTGQTGTAYANEFKKRPTVFYLDATAGPVFHLAVRGVEEVEIKVRQPLYVIQTTNSLYTARSLEGDDGKGLDKISRAIGATVERFGCKRPVIFSRKAFNPDFKQSAGGAASNNRRAEPPPTTQPPTVLNVAGGEGVEVRYGHFERHNKGLDDYADADMVAIVGHYSQPLDEITAQVEAFRVRTVALEPSERGGSWLLKAYGWRGANGKGLARWCKAHPDPEIQAAIEHSTVATIMQTIGRGRAALRPSNQPLIVALFTSMPLAGLAIDVLTGVNDILEIGQISEKQAAALKAGREALNTERRSEAVAKIETARQELAKIGQMFMAPGRFAKAAQVSRTTLRSLGYLTGGRWIRLADIPDTVSQEIYISLLSNPVCYKPEYPTSIAVKEPENDFSGSSDLLKT